MIKAFDCVPRVQATSSLIITSVTANWEFLYVTAIVGLACKEIQVDDFPSVLTLYIPFGINFSTSSHYLTLFVIVYTYAAY
jgi:hypothetical protein